MMPSTKATAYARAKAAAKESKKYIMIPPMAGPQPGLIVWLVLCRLGRDPLLGRQQDDFTVYRRGKEANLKSALAVGPGCADPVEVTFFVTTGHGIGD
ncbi:hypothetical protein AAY24_18225 (plasmid) [Sedimenticola thiotaurini]|uniref:Uncharacterized protein n=1 Tax=Sedimenticola thiotaurini TaxID=1543721 RepID=A0A0F7K4B5_9GAMM|nr:hypothetical protein AAY24_18225 [Sedimenticola thiotaurini]